MSEEKMEAEKVDELFLGLSQSTRDKIKKEQELDNALVRIYILATDTSQDDETVYRKIKTIIHEVNRRVSNERNHSI